MADCGEYTHQAIAYQGLFDLKDMQIIRAEIDSIDDEANTAAVTVLDECDFDDWLTTSAVPFFYHCEFSTGTVEDLAKGYKAFAIGDIVFIILLPGRGEDFPPQAYIVGHVDIRGTKECLPREFLYIRFTFFIDEVETTIVSIYDVTAGATLDLASFEPIDESSPAPPARFPCIQTTAVLNWYAYNFSTATPRVSMPCVVSVPSAGDFSALDIPKTTDELTSYTGHTSQTLCSSITVGNGLRHDLEIRDGLHPTITEYDAYGYYKTQPNNFSGADIHPVGGDICGVYAGSSTNLVERIEDYGEGWFNISVSATIGYPFTPFTVPILRRDEYAESIVLTCNGESATIEFATNFQNKYTIDFSAISGPEFVHTLNSTISSTFTIADAPAAGAQVDDIVPSSGSIDKTWAAIPNRIISSLSTTFSGHYLHPWSSMENEGNSIKSGEVGVYVLWGAVGLQEWYLTGGSNPYRCTVYPQPSVWGGFVDVIDRGSTDVELRIVFQPFSTVTLIEGNYTIVPPYITVPIEGCFANADTGRSNGLNTTISAMAGYIMDEHIAPLPTSFDRYNATLEVFSGLQDGPSITVLKKKVSI